VSPEDWDRELTARSSPAPLLQSWGYGEVQAEEGWDVERLRLPGGGVATVLLQGGGALRWAYVPRGPVPATASVVADLVTWARERRLARLRVEPEGPPELAGELRELGFHPVPPFHPQHTRIVPLGEEEAMLASFKPKHRYNIRLALRRGVTVEEGSDADELWRQTQGTERRQQISLLTAEQNRRRLDRLAWCRTYVARQEGEALAAIMVSHFHGRATYLFGGAIGHKLSLMPTYAVQWAAMRAAAEAGCRDYDLFGIPPPDAAPSHPWQGLVQFKSGFGGEAVALCGAWDLVLSPLAARVAGLAAGARRTARRLR
jgi:peptidoglycan pentaglycine glycine transferase (the first glycine)